MAEDGHKKKIDELRSALLTDLSSNEIENLQIKVDMLMRLAAVDGDHHHHSQGGVGHHDDSALADLAWRLERPRAIFQSSKKK